jgi:hypothetical protein
MKLKTVTLRGYKSIVKLEDFELRSLRSSHFIAMLAPSPTCTHVVDSAKVSYSIAGQIGRRAAWNRPGV